MLLFLLAPLSLASFSEGLLRIEGGEIVLPGKREEDVFPPRADYEVVFPTLALQEDQLYSLASVHYVVVPLPAQIPSVEDKEHESFALPRVPEGKGK